jgi:thiazole/oxazole-forming peptide maturase SagD family component
VYIARYGLDPAYDDQPPNGSGLRRAIGAGGTDAAARVSALGEAIERYSGAFQGDEPRVRGSLRVLGEAAIHPNQCMQFSEGQYEDRRAGGTVPRPLDPEEQLDWTPVRPLAGGECRFLPTALLYTGYPARGDPCCVSDLSGVAASPAREGALLHALLELIERDSLAIWWYNRVRRPAVSLAALPHSHSLGIPDHHRAHGRDVWALDLTSDLGVPVFVALSRRDAGAGSQRIALGFGAHLDPVLALGRALAEMDQVLCAAAADEREGRLGLAVRRWLGEATLENQPYLAPRDGPAQMAEQLPSLATGDIRGDLEACERLLARRSLRAFWLDQTRPDIGVPVVRVVVPGLRHFRARYAPGRLYATPVSAGWLDRPRREAELNPIEFFL